MSKSCWRTSTWAASTAEHWWQWSDLHQRDTTGLRTEQKPTQKMNVLINHVHACDDFHGLSESVWIFSGQDRS